MSYFLRFTNTASEDLERGTSLLELPSLSEAKILPGLCGYSFASYEEFNYIMTDSEIESKVTMFKNNVFYTGVAVLFEGEYLDNNVNGEGVIFKAESIKRIF